MKQPFEAIAELNRLIHEPARLSLMTALASCESADFLFLQGLTGLSKGNLSSHLSKLEAAELVLITKQFVGKKPNTQVALTKSGRALVEEHWKKLEALRKQAGRWKPTQSA